MSPTENIRILYQSHPAEFIIPGETTKLVREPLDINNLPLKEGEFLLRGVVVSSDPYLRVRMRPAGIESFSPAFNLGKPIDNFGVGKVLRSRNADYKEGDYLYGFLTFEDFAVRNSEDSLIGWTKLEKPDGIPWTFYVGVLGMPGQTAYFGWQEFLEEEAKTSTIMFVSGGAGSVGSFVIQIAKIRYPQLRIIASAGSEDKVEFMKAVGADVVFNYKAESTQSVLQKHGPIDIYWDNVGGPTLDDALINMSLGGVVVACGSITGYNQDSPSIKNFGEIFGRSLTVHGLLHWRLVSKYKNAFFEEVPRWVEEGKVRAKEQRYEGLENAEQALLDVHTGANQGKAVVAISDD